MQSGFIPEISSQPWYCQLQDWQKRHIDHRGRYVGEELSGYRYRPGNYVPVDARYSAMLEWRYAFQAMLMKNSIPAP